MLMNDLLFEIGYFGSTILTYSIGERNMHIINHLKNKEIIEVDYLALGSYQKSDDIDPINKMLEEVISNHRLVFIISEFRSHIDIELALIGGEAAKNAELKIGVVILPLSFEGNMVRTDAWEGLDSLKRLVDLLIVIPDDQILTSNEQELNRDESINADSLVISAIRCITAFAALNGKLHSDLWDLAYVARNTGFGYILEGKASGENRAMNAIMRAFVAKSVIVDQILKAKSLIIYIFSNSEDISIEEFGEMFDYLQTRVNENCNIFWDFSYESQFDEEINIVIIGVGCDEPNFFDISQD